MCIFNIIVSESEKIKVEKYILNIIVSKYMKQTKKQYNMVNYRYMKFYIFFVLDAIKKL